MKHLLKYHVGHIQCHFLYSLSSILLHALNIFLFMELFFAKTYLLFKCLLWTILLHVFIPGTMCSYIQFINVISHVQSFSDFSHLISNKIVKEVQTVMHRLCAVHIISKHLFWVSMSRHVLMINAIIGQVTVFCVKHFGCQDWPRFF